MTVRGKQLGSRAMFFIVVESTKSGLCKNAEYWAAFQACWDWRWVTNICVLTGILDNSADTKIPDSPRKTQGPQYYIWTELKHWWSVSGVPSKPPFLFFSATARVLDFIAVIMVNGNMERKQKGKKYLVTSLKIVLMFPVMKTKLSAYVFNTAVCLPGTSASAG